MADAARVGTARKAGTLEVYLTGTGDRLKAELKKAELKLDGPFAARMPNRAGGRGDRLKAELQLAGSLPRLGRF